MKRIMALFLLSLLLTLCAAAETVLPDENIFSPGFAAITQALQDGGTLETDLSAQVSKIFFITDIRVLQEILNGLSVKAVTGPAGSGEATQMTVSRNGELVSQALLYADDAGSYLQLGGKLMDTGSYAAKLSIFPEEIQSALTTGGWNRFERLPLEAIESLLQGMEEGQHVFGYTVKEPLSLEHIMSDDGERFTRLTFTGTFADSADAEWQLKGELFRPGTGKSPRDTAEVTLERDKDNKLALTMSALHQYSSGRKNADGTVTVKTRLHLEGKLNGYALDTTLTITQKNAWKASDAGLDETISVTMGFDWQNKDPALDSLNLNRISADTHETIRLDPTDPLAWTDDATLKVVTSGETILNGQLHMASRIGGEAPAALQGPAQPVTVTGLDEALKAEGEAAARVIYNQLDAGTQNLIEKGL